MVSERPRRPRATATSAAAGFTLVEMLAVIAVLTIIAGMAVPLLKDSNDAMQIGIQARNIERTLQEARLKAVKANQPMRVRFNCPATGQYRVVELLGTPSAPLSADTATSRCDMTAYPHCPPGSTTSPCDNDIVTRPNHDGPVQRLESATTFTGGQTVEFWPDGTAHIVSGSTLPWPMITGDTGIGITVSRKGKTKQVMVNGFGKTKIQ